MGFIERRQKLKIIRYRRFNKATMPWEHYREQLMLFMPWRNEMNEVQVNNTFEQFSKFSTVIGRNRRKFENLIRNETEAEALERMEQEIEDQEDLNYVIRAAEQNRIDNLLMGREVPTNTNLDGQELINQLDQDTERQNELLEQETGYHADNESDRQIRSRGLTSSDKDAKARRRMDDDEYKRFMNRLNRKQHTFLINCLNKVKKGETFHDLVVGESGTGKSNLIKALGKALSSLSFMISMLSISVTIDNLS
jgi:predicted AAA+ superfamily ATPase